ncbi:MAG: endolytic transglycosylase MltG [Muribaculaceae bacterium]|nr:endolytic transglycosylase MltG [Muribaculaceae bacterium]
MLYLLLGLTVIISLFLLFLYPIVMDKADHEATIRIPRNATKDQVYDSISTHLGDEFATHVMRTAGILHSDVSTRHGMYVINKGDNALSAARRLTSGGQTPVRITINGFRSLPLLIERVSRKMEFPADSLRAVLTDPSFMAKYGLTPEQALALFIDDTYEVYWTTDARSTVEKIGKNYLYLWNEQNREIARELGVTPAEMMIVASIADEETNVAEEKGIIGKLYLNRLRNKMRLQADPTVRFAIGDFTIQRISKEDLKKDSPYNTYLHSGLPPGPIRTTGMTTVKNILRAAPHDYLYMCAKEDFSGRHNFSDNYQDHLDNAARYQAALDRRGIHR